MLAVLLAPGKGGSELAKQAQGHVHKGGPQQAELRDPSIRPSGGRVKPGAPQWRGLDRTCCPHSLGTLPGDAGWAGCSFRSAAWKGCRKHAGL